MPYPVFSQEPDGTVLVFFQASMLWAFLVLRVGVRIRWSFIGGSSDHCKLSPEILVEVRV